ncbi:hypothetical protein [Nocardia gamkensis]|uniref:Uncharacterized protein n=1 Tax=Nocardia gamkensis TaxID=352869 RepID=A0A7X6L4H9_9NOCA|nr:hypothetical protein [Nocardia gamkensis]NKY27575.1 hypothetical protein [Nocardia gamkensis]NQE71726.1 hypothetical protein [Nocardia gamkensis]
MTAEPRRTGRLTDSSEPPKPGTSPAGTGGGAEPAVPALVGGAPETGDQADLTGGTGESTADH